MALTVSCRALGMNCDYVATGTTMDQLFEDAAHHDVAVHGASETKVHSEEWREELRAIVRNISRSPDLRASEPELTQVEPVEGEKA